MPCSLSSNLNYPSYLKNILKEINAGKDQDLKDAACDLRTPVTEEGCVVADGTTIGAFPFCWTLLDREDPDFNRLVGPGTHNPIKMSLTQAMDLYWNSTDHAGYAHSRGEAWSPCKLSEKSTPIPECRRNCNENNIPLSRPNASANPKAGNYPYIFKGVPTKKHLVFRKNISLNMKYTTTITSTASPPCGAAGYSSTSVQSFGGFFGEGAFPKNNTIIPCNGCELLQVRNYYVKVSDTVYDFYPTFSITAGAYHSMITTVSPVNLWSAWRTACGNGGAPYDIKQGRIDIRDLSWNINFYRYVSFYDVGLGCQAPAPYALNLNYKTIVILTSEQS